MRRSLLISLFIFSSLLIGLWFMEGSPIPMVYAEDEAPTRVPAPTIDDLKKTVLPPNLPTFEKAFSGVKDPVQATESFFLNYIISPIFLLAAGVAVIMILYASFRIITARGEEEGITKAKTTLIWAAAGLALIMLAYTLVRNISTILVDIQGPPPGS